METIHKDTLKKIFDGMKAELTLWNDPTSGAYIIKELEHRLMLDVDESIYGKSPIQSILPELQKLDNIQKGIKILCDKPKHEFLEIKTSDDIPKEMAVLYDNHYDKLGIITGITTPEKKKRDGSNISKRMKEFTALASKIFDKNKETWHEARKRAKVIIDKGEYDLYINPDKPKQRINPKLLSAKNNPEYAARLKKDYEYMKLTRIEKTEIPKKFKCTVCYLNEVESKGEMCDDCDKHFNKISHKPKLEDSAAMEELKFS